MMADNLGLLEVLGNPVDMKKKYVGYAILSGGLIITIIIFFIAYAQSNEPYTTIATAIPSLLHLPLISKPKPKPSMDWDFNLDEPYLVSNHLGVPIYPWFPDGHISVLQDKTNGWIMFWAEFESYRSIGSQPYPEDQTKLVPNRKVFGERGGEGWDNGGSWLNSVFRLSDTHLIGFYHAEDHWNPPNPNGIAWKSIGVTYSNDNGVSWSTGEQIITSWKTKPIMPEWGGAGDHSIVWDEQHQRWVCYYQEVVENGEAQLHIAVSVDTSGRPGTWYKWDGFDFAVPGLGGKGVPIAAFRGREGANPSVHWNDYLAKWIIVYGGWDGSIYISSSTDMLNWDLPEVLVISDQDGRAWYPTVISDMGDTLAGKSARLYYADIANDFSSRKFYARTITFTRND